MTDDARDAAIGRTVTEYRDKKNRLAALRSELVRAGESLKFLGLGLSSNPELLDFGGDSFSMSDLQQTKLVETKYLDRDSLHSQVKDYRSLKAEVERLTEQVREFGLTP